MGTITRICPTIGCNARIPANLKRCDLHRRADNQRRHAKAHTNGITTRPWRDLRAAALNRDHHACRSCGTTTDLTVHLSPHLRGHHQGATLPDLTTLCRSCHGTIDAPRARSMTKGGDAG